MRFNTQAEMMAANETGLYLPQDTGNLTPGVACMANTSRFIEAHFSEPLTTYATGWRDPEGLQDLLDFVAPPVEVPRRFEYVVFVNQEAFLLETDDVRAIGADFKRVEYSQSKATSNTLNKGLVYRVDLDNVDQNTNWREKIVSQLQLRIIRNDVRRSILLLAAAAVNTALTWDTTAGKDPDMDVINQVVTATGIIGLAPSRGLYDLVAWQKRALSHRSQNTAGAFGSANLDIDAVASLVGLQGGMVARNQYASSPTGKSGLGATSTGAAQVLIFLANAAQSVDDPSNIKRFVTQTMGGTMIRVYEQQINMKLIDITVEQYSRPLITSTLGIRSLTIS
jgi:hypothetical protein